MLFDTHAHLTDEAFDGDRADVLHRIRENGVSLLLNAGSSVRSSEDSVKLAEEYDFIYASVGVHPEDCKDMTSNDLQKIAALAQNKKAVAVGEIGLDYHYDFTPRDVQKRHFSEQLELARELDLPVIIHDREAHGDTLEIVKKIKVQRGVFHCYSGSLEMAKELLGLGYLLSFTGVITFKNAARSHEIVKWLPDDKIMIETDSPYLSPEPLRGKRNDPGNVRLVAQKIAEIKGKTLQEIAALTMKNGREFFNI
ncbi:MAG: TatD family hydrolase [Bacillota bacterium]|nr:TatD family hydrolase [Bacillota bacterium]